MQRLRTLHLFAGAGGGILGDILLGHIPVGAVEIDPYAQRVLQARQADGCLPWFPIFGDIKQFDGTRYRGLADIVAGGFPCQDVSCAGKVAGIEGARSGLWSEMARVIGEVRPRFAFVENSPMLVRRGLTTVLGDLATLGYDARWCVLGAHHVGAPHHRERLWILGYSALREHSIKRGGSDQAQAKRGVREPRRSTWWATEPIVGRMADGLANQLDRQHVIGNGQVPRVAALAWTILGGPLT